MRTDKLVKIIPFNYHWAIRLLILEPLKKLHVIDDGRYGIREERSPDHISEEVSASRYSTYGKEDDHRTEHHVKQS